MEDKEVRRALEGRAGKRKRGGERFVVVDPAESDDDHNDSHGDYGEGYSIDNGIFSDTATQQFESVAVVDSTLISEQTFRAPPEVGSALRRNADGTVVAPKISNRKVKGKQVWLLSYDCPEIADNSIYLRLPSRAGRVKRHRFRIKFPRNRIRPSTVLIRRTIRMKT